MKVEALLGQVTEEVVFPTHLVFCDLADFKRRNAHLGFEAGDEEIADFDRAAARAAPLVARVGGDQWLALTDAPEDFVRQVMGEYGRRWRYRAGWRCTAEGLEGTKMIEQTVETTLERSCRFVGAPVDGRDSIAGAAEALVDQGWGTRPGQYVELSDPVPRDDVRWECVRDYPKSYPYCPFCGGIDFEWFDGGTGVYDAEGSCRGCRASVSIEDAGGICQ